MKNTIKAVALGLALLTVSLDAHVTRINSLTQLQSIVSSTKTVVIKFFAEWCGPCKKYKKHFENVSNQVNGATFVQVDIDKMSDIASSYGVRSLPTTVIIKNGQKVAQITGVQGESELKSLVTQNL